MTLLDTINRAITFTIERHWIEHVAILMNSILPSAPSDWLSQSFRVLLVSMLLLALGEVLSVVSSSDKRDKTT